MDFVVKNTEKTDEKMRKQESKFKQLEALTTGMINPIKNCSIKPNHWKAKHGLGRECTGLDVLRIHNPECTAVMLVLRLGCASNIKPRAACFSIAFQLLNKFPLWFSQDQVESAEADVSLGGFARTEPNCANTGRQHDIGHACQPNVEQVLPKSLE